MIYWYIPGPYQHGTFLGFYDPLGGKYAGLTYQDSNSVKFTTFF